MAFCGNCGSPVGNGKFCPKCGTPVEQESMIEKNTVHKTKTLKNKKPPVIGIVMGVALIFVIIIGLILIPHPVNERCDWCGNSPSIAYKTHDESDAYVCRKCSKECAWCGKKASKHYESELGLIVFVCKDCYKDIVEMNK